MARCCGNPENKEKCLIFPQKNNTVSTFEAPAGHEARPENPEEQRAQQREGVGGLGGGHQGRVGQVDRRVQRPAHTQPWEGEKG